MENEKKPKKKIWRKIGEALLEIFGELFLFVICFAIGAGVLYSLGQIDLIHHWDPEAVMVLGVMALLAVAGIVIVIVAIIKKKKK